MSNQVKLSDYVSRTLIVDSDRVIKLDHNFSKVVFEVENRELNIQGVEEVEINYECTDISWLPKDIKKLTIDSSVFDQPLDHLIALTQLEICSDVFNQPLNELSALTRLEINSVVFNQPLNELVALTYLWISSPVFNQSLDTLVALTNSHIHSLCYQKSCIIL